MITPYIIDDTAWTPITLIGQNGSCWLDEENDDAEGQADIRVYHQAGGLPTIDKLSTAKKIYRCSGNNDSAVITADSGLDVYYARCVSGKVTLIVDVL